MLYLILTKLCFQILKHHYLLCLFHKCSMHIRLFTQIDGQCCANCLFLIDEREKTFSGVF